MTTQELSSDPIADIKTPDDLVSRFEQAMRRARELQESLSALKSNEGPFSWEQTFGAFDELSFVLSEAGNVPSLFGMTHPDETMRNVALACEPKIDAFVSDLYMNEHVYESLKSYADQNNEQPEDRKRFIEHTLRDYRRNGLALDAEKRGRLRELNARLTELCQAFEKNLAERTGSIRVSKKQLAGLPSSYIERLVPDADGLFNITTSTPNYVPFMTYAEDREAARSLGIAYDNRAADVNLPLLDEILKLRKEKSTLLGYQTWADYILETRMAKTSENVRDFLDRLHGALRPKRDEEFEEFRAMATRLGWNADAIRSSDSAYLDDQICKTSYALDTKILSEYFETRATVRGAMHIASRLFKIEFRKADSAVWHKDVEVFDVFDNDKTLGRLYLDLYPRENKYQHAAMFSIRRSMEAPDGTRLLPMVALVCNFPKPDSSKTSPALMTHGDATTLFHEFGHALHALLSRTRLSSFSGTHTVQDFVEVPSQLFEEWVWVRESLNDFARHYQTGDIIPDALFNALTAARRFGLATFAERQLSLADLDQTYHTLEPNFDTTEILKKIHEKYSRFQRTPDTYFQSHFGHLMSYDAAYYGYQWSLSIAEDLLTRFRTEGFFNPETASAYRTAILERGGELDESELIRLFLGRPSTPDAYLKFLGV